MVAAVPVVATAVSGSVDLIVDGENGRLVPPSDPEALASALRATLENPSDLGARGRETVLALCEIGRVVNLYESLLTNLARLPEGILSAGRLSAYARSERRPGSRDEGEMKPPIRSGAYDRPG
jgi:glycosyltransferase involved in cell wall biosynthesis